MQVDGSFILLSFLMMLLMVLEQILTRTTVFSGMKSHPHLAELSQLKDQVRTHLSASLI